MSKVPARFRRDECHYSHAKRNVDEEALTFRQLIMLSARLTFNGKDEIHISPTWMSNLHIQV